MSAEAALWLLERGMTELATPIDEYYGDRKDSDDSLLGYKANIKKWREYLAQTDSKKRRDIFLTVFSTDEKYVVDVHPKPRDHPLLIQCVETLGEAVNGACAKLEIIEIPDGVEWGIEEYDGCEWVAETHRTWSS